MKTNKLIYLFSFVILSCTSAKKQNEFNNKKISVEKLHKDLNFTQKKLFAMHPDADFYTPKDSILLLFNQTKNKITQPLTPKEFYFELAPIIASIKQGHSRAIYPSEVSTKETLKKYKNTQGPLSQLGYIYTDNKLYVTHINNKKNEVPSGSEIIEINGITPQQLFANYCKNNASDGFNKTYLEKGFSKRFPTQFTDKFGTLDSIKLKLSCSDSIFYVTNKRINLKEKKAEKKDSLKTKTDTLKTQPKKILTKDEKAKLKLESKKLLEKINYQRKMGWVNGSINKQIIFPIPTDSTFAILKIKSFSSGRIKSAYDTIFNYINSKNIQHLVLDLRDNPGGRILDIDHLYSYLKLKNEPIISEASVVNKTKLPGYFITGKSVGSYIALTPVYPFLYSWVYLNTTKNQEGKYNYKVAGIKSREIKPNAFKNKLSVLVNGGSFSASCLITSNLKGSQRALVYGEETGGTYNGTVAGIMPLLKLPNSKLKVRLGLMHIKSYHQTQEFARGIKPDFPIKLITDEQIYNANYEYEYIYKINQKQEDTEITTLK